MVRHTDMKMTQEVRHLCSGFPANIMRDPSGKHQGWTGGRGKEGEM